MKHSVLASNKQQILVFRDKNSGDGALNDLKFLNFAQCGIIDSKLIVYVAVDDEVLMVIEKHDLDILFA